MILRLPLISYLLITGAKVFTVIGSNKHVFNFEAASTFSTLILNAVDRYHVAVLDGIFVGFLVKGGREGAFNTCCIKYLDITHRGEGVSLCCMCKCNQFLL